MRIGMNSIVVLSVALSVFGCGGGQRDFFRVDYTDDPTHPKEVTVMHTQLRNLERLGGVLSVKGDLVVVDNELLASCSGLDNLGSVGRDLILSGNPKLTNLDHLNSLSKVSRDLNIVGNGALKSLDGLVGLKSVERNLQISDNENLVELTGIGGLTFLGGNLLLASSRSKISRRSEVCCALKATPTCPRAKRNNSGTGYLGRRTSGYAGT
jgi:hypothetical protein